MKIKEKHTTSINNKENLRNSKKIKAYQQRKSKYFEEMTFKENYRKPKKSKQYQTMNKSEKIIGNNREIFKT